MLCGSADWKKSSLSVTNDSPAQAGGHVKPEMTALFCRYLAWLWPFLYWLTGHSSFPKHNVVHDSGVDSAAIEGCGKLRIVSQLARIGVP